MQQSLVPLNRPLLGQRAPRLRRALADLVDRLIPMPFLAHFFWPWALVCVAYDLVTDARGGSPGKRLLGLQVQIVSPRHGLSGQPCNLGRSILRNLLWGVARLCYASSVLTPIGIAYDVMECLLAAFSPTGRRLGDLLAGTQVVAHEEGRL
jgi:uncharacterized RDD family membrane protein YckC